MKLYMSADWFPWCQCHSLCATIPYPCNPLLSQPSHQAQPLCVLRSEWMILFLLPSTTVWIFYGASTTTARFSYLHIWACPNEQVFILSQQQQHLRSSPNLPTVHVKSILRAVMIEIFGKKAFFQFSNYQWEIYNHKTPLTSLLDHCLYEGVSCGIYYITHHSSFSLNRISGLGLLY